MLKINPSEAPGPDEIQGTVLKACQYSSSALEDLSEVHFYKYSTPRSDWRTANVIPV